MPQKCCLPSIPAQRRRRPLRGAAQARRRLPTRHVGGVQGALVLREGVRGLDLLHAAGAGAGAGAARGVRRRTEVPNCQTLFPAAAPLCTGTAVAAAAAWGARSQQAKTRRAGAAEHLELVTMMTAPSRRTLQGPVPSEQSLSAVAGRCQQAGGCQQAGKRKGSFGLVPCRGVPAHLPLPIARPASPMQHSPSGAASLTPCTTICSPRPSCAQVQLPAAACGTASAGLACF